MNYYHRRVREWCVGGEEELDEGMVGERDTAEVESVGETAGMTGTRGAETVARRFSTRTEEVEEREPELPPFAGMMPPVRIRLRVLVPGSQRERLRLMVVNVRKIRLRVVVSKPMYD